MYKSPNGVGEYRSKLKNFLFIAQQGMTMPQQAMVQQQASRPSLKQMLTKDFLIDYVYGSLSDDFDNSEIQLAAKQLIQAGHDQNLVSMAIREAIERKKKDIKATPDDFKKDLNDVESEIQAEEDRKFREEEAEEERRIQEGFAEDDAAFEESMEDDEVDQELLFGDNKSQESEEPEDIKQLGGLVKFNLGGKIPPALIKLFTKVDNVIVTGMKLDDLVRQQAIRQLASLGEDSQQLAKYKSLDDAYADPDFMQRVFNTTEAELQSTAKLIDEADQSTGTMNAIKKKTGVGSTTAKLTDDALKNIKLKSTWLNQADEIAELSKKLEEKIKIGTTGKEVKGIPRDKTWTQKIEPTTDLQTEKLSQSKQGIALDVDDGIYMIDEGAEGMAGQSDEWVKQLDNKAKDYFKNAPSGTTTGKNMSFKSYTSDGLPIVSVQRSDGNVINGVLTKVGDSYQFKHILGVNSDLTPIYSTVEDIGIKGDDLVETFMGSSNNQLKNLDEFDEAFKIGEFGPGTAYSQKVPFPEEQLIQPSGTINSAKSDYNNFSTNYVKGIGAETGLGKAYNIGKSVAETGSGGLFTSYGQGTNALFGKNNYLTNKFNINESILRSNATAKNTPVYNPVIGAQTYTNPLRGGFGLWGDATKIGADQNWLSRSLGYNQGVTGFKLGDDARSIHTVTGYTPARMGKSNSTLLNVGTYADEFGGMTGDFTRRMSRFALSPRIPIFTVGTGSILSGLNFPSQEFISNDQQLQLNPGQTAGEDQSQTQYTNFSDTSAVNLNIPSGGQIQLSLDEWNNAIGNTMGFEAIGDRSLYNDPAAQKAVFDFYNATGAGAQVEKRLGGMSKAQYVRKGLKEFNAGGMTTETPADINTEVVQREDNKNTIINVSQDNVKEFREKERLEKEYDQLRAAEEGIMLNNQGQQMALFGAQSRNMRKLGRQMKRLGRQIRRNNMPSNMTSFNSSGNMFNRNITATFDPNVPNMNMLSGMFGTGIMPNILSRIANTAITSGTPYKYTVPLITNSNKANIVTDADKEKANNEMVTFPKVNWPTAGVNENSSPMELFNANPPKMGETKSAYMARTIGNPGFVFDGSVWNGTSFVAQQQLGGFVDPTRPDLNKFVYGGDELTRANLGLSVPGPGTGEEEAIVNANIGNQVMLDNEGMSSTPIWSMQNEQFVLPNQVDPIMVDPNMTGEKIVEEDRPVFDEASGLFMMQSQLNQNQEAEDLDKSAEAIADAMKQVPPNMEIPADVKSEGAQAILTYVFNQQRREAKMTGFSANITPNLQSGFQGASGQVAGSWNVGQRGNPGTINAKLSGTWNNPGYQGDEKTDIAGFEEGTQVLNADGSISYVTPKSNKGNAWEFSGGLNLQKNQGQKASLTPTIGVNFIPGNNQFGGEPAPYIPEYFGGGFFRTLGRGLSANPAFGQGFRYSGPQTLQGAAYYGIPQNMYKQEIKRRPFGFGRITNYYGDPNREGAENTNDNKNSNWAGFPFRPDVNKDDINQGDEEVLSRFDRRANRALARQERRAARPGEREERKSERQWERNRRRGIRQGMGDLGSYQDEQARLAEDAEKDFAPGVGTITETGTSSTDTNPAASGESLSSILTQGRKGRKLIRKGIIDEQGVVQAIDDPNPPQMAPTYEEFMAQRKAQEPEKTEETVSSGPQAGDMGYSGYMFNKYNYDTNPTSSSRNAFAMGLIDADGKPTSEFLKGPEPDLEALNQKMMLGNYGKGMTFGSANNSSGNQNTGVGADPNYAAKIEGNYDPVGSGAPSLPPTIARPNPTISQPSTEEMIESDVNAAMQYGGWIYNEGGEYDDGFKTAWMTNEEIEAFMRAGGVVEFI